MSTSTNTAQNAEAGRLMCPACGYKAEHIPEFTLLPGVQLCGDCWTSMTAFERALLVTLGESAVRICETLEQELPSVGSQIAASMEGER